MVFPSLPQLIAILGRGGCKSPHLAMHRGAKAYLAVFETIRAFLQINKIKEETRKFLIASVEFQCFAITTKQQREVKG